MLTVQLMPLLVKIMTVGMMANIVMQMITQEEKNTSMLYLPPDVCELLVWFLQRLWSYWIKVYYTASNVQYRCSIIYFDPIMIRTFGEIVILLLITHKHQGEVKHRSILFLLCINLFFIQYISPYTLLTHPYTVYFIGS
jgi:hypothetical protein